MCGVYWFCVNNSLNKAGLTNDSDCGHYVGNGIVMFCVACHECQCDKLVTPE